MGGMASEFTELLIRHGATSSLNGILIGVKHRERFMVDLLILELHDRLLKKCKVCIYSTMYHKNVR